MSQDKTNDYLYIRQVWQRNGSVVSMLIDQSVIAMYFRFTQLGLQNLCRINMHMEYVKSLVFGFVLIFIGVLSHV